MATQKKSRGVIFIEKNFCQIVVETNPSVFTFQYPPQVVQDLEIIRIDEFHKQFLLFLTQNKIPMGDFIMVLGNNLFFVKDIQKALAPTDKSPQKPLQAISAEEVEIQKFLSAVPFENVSFKVFKKDQLVRILATNRELFEAFKKTIEKQGGRVIVIIPGFAFELFKNIKIEQSITPDSARIIMKNIDSIKDQSMLVNQEPVASDDDIKRVPEPPSPLKDPKKRMLGLGGIFGILILILIGVSIWQFVLVGNEKPPPPTPEPVQIAAIPSVTPETGITATGSSILEKQAITVQITSNSRDRDAAIQLRDQLAQIGFANTRIGTTNTNPQTTQAVFKPTVNTTIRQELIDLLNKLYSGVSVVENNDAQFDANITIAATSSANVIASPSASVSPL